MRLTRGLPALVAAAACAAGAEAFVLPAALPAAASVRVSSRRTPGKGGTRTGRHGRGCCMMGVHDGGGKDHKPKGFGKSKKPQSMPKAPGGEEAGSSTRQMLLQFTCNKCEGRNQHKINKVAYEEGVVIVTCHSCGVRHLIADNKGLLDDPDFGAGNLEQFIAASGRSDMQRLSTPHLDAATAAKYNLEVDSEGNVQVAPKARQPPPSSSE